MAAFQPNYPDGRIYECEEGPKSSLEKAALERAGCEIWYKATFGNERFHKTVLDEFYRVAFRRKIYTALAKVNKVNVTEERSSVLLSNLQHHCNRIAVQRYDNHKKLPISRFNWFGRVEAIKARRECGRTRRQ